MLSGTLQMEVVMTPSNATNLEVIWSVQNQTGEATIDTGGLLTAIADGTVDVKATSIGNPTIEGSLVITISNQPAESKVALIAAIDLANENINSVAVSVDGDDVLPANQWVSSMVMDTYAAVKIAAQVVYDQINANQNLVDDVISALNAATIIFDAAKAFGIMVIALLELNTAMNYAVLAKSGISSTGVSNITGDMGISPGIETAITGFSLTQDADGYFSKSEQVVGSIFASDNASPTPTSLIQAITDMESAYTVGQGLVPTGLPDLYEGDLSGETLTNGIYSWSTGIVINSDLTLSGSANDVWIFQMSGSLTQETNVDIILTGGALAEHIFWLVDGDVFVGAESTIKGNVFANMSIALDTNATVYGRLFAQTEVTLTDATVISNVIEPSEITIQTAGEILEINTAGGTLQMSAEVLPMDTSNPWVIWSVVNQTGTAIFNPDGLLTAVYDGTVLVKATSINYPLIYGEIIITLSNQVALSKAILTEAVLNANTNYEGVVVSVDATSITTEQVWVTSIVLLTYQNAIDTAQSIIDFASATQAQVNDAVTTLADATNSFNEEKEFGTLQESLSQTVNLGTAADFAILAKTAISTTGSTAITGDIGVSPVAASYLTGFDLSADPSNAFSTSTYVSGKLLASDYSDPTPAYLSTAISDMEDAYTTGMGYTPDATELHGGDLSGQTIVAGIYKWGTDVLINSDHTLSGSATDTWIFQISGKLTLGADVSIILSGGALASNVFWIAADTIAVGANSHLQGNIMSKTNITMGTGSSVVGRLFAQTAITLSSTTVTKPD